MSTDDTKNKNLLQLLAEATPKPETEAEPATVVRPFDRPASSARSSRADVITEKGAAEIWLLPPKVEALVPILIVALRRSHPSDDAASHIAGYLVRPPLLLLIEQRGEVAVAAAVAQMLVLIATQRINIVDDLRSELDSICADQNTQNTVHVLHSP